MILYIEFRMNRNLTSICREAEDVIQHAARVLSRQLIPTSFIMLCHLEPTATCIAFQIPITLKNVQTWSRLKAPRISLFTLNQSYVYNEINILGTSGDP